MKRITAGVFLGFTHATMDTMQNHFESHNMAEGRRETARLLWDQRHPTESEPFPAAPKATISRNQVFNNSAILVMEKPIFKSC